MRANATSGRAEEAGFPRLARAVAGTGGLMLGLSTFQAEFDFGVPQFRLVFGPILVMLAAGVGLVAVRIYAGRGAAIGAAFFFVLMRGMLALAIGPGLGQTMPHFPLYIVEALVVEAVALRVSTDRPLRFGLWAGLGIGTFGLGAEWLWSNLWMPLPWTSGAFPEAALLGFVAAIAGSALGAWIGSHLSPEPAPGQPLLRRAAVCSAAVLAALVAIGLYSPTERGVSAQVALRDLPSRGGREVQATVRIDPADAPVGAAWFNVTAWQGGGLVVDPLQKIGDGVYRTTKPIPVHGDWKTLIRLHQGDSLASLPIYLPRDEAIPVGEVPASTTFTRAFRSEHKQLQREQKGGSPVVVALAYSIVVAIALGLLALLAWALHRLSTGGAPCTPRRHLARRGRLLFGHGASGG
jgi:hypothetical protein